MSGLGSFVRSLLGLPRPAREHGPIPGRRVEDGAHPEVERETVRELRHGLHGRRADRQIGAAEREAEGLRARMAMLKAHGELDARGGGGN